jgi:hypothetical protein
MNRIPKTHHSLGDLTVETRDKIKQLFEETIRSEMNMDYWRMEVRDLGVTREDLAAWFGNSAHSIGILQFEDSMSKDLDFGSTYEETYAGRNSRSIGSAGNLNGPFRVSEKDLCNVFWRLDNDFNGEIDFWELEKILMVKNLN